ncbi:hypothetical protein HK100_008361, partial [Physocladia obscura]
MCQFVVAQLNATVTLSGILTFAHSTTLNDSIHLLTISGNSVVFQSDPTNPGIIDGLGQLYWDGQGANGGVLKPKLVSTSFKGISYVRGIKIVNAPVSAFSVGGVDTVFDSIVYDNSLGAPLSNGTLVGHNTDAFDVSASNIVIMNSYVINQDDCLAINKGSNITFQNNTCIGGHGISIGSIKTGAVVNNVLVSNCSIIDSQNGVRIKTVYNDTDASVSNILYENILLTNISIYGIDVQQDYLNGGPTGIPGGQIPITNLTLTNITGTVLPDEGALSTYILCATGE